MDFLDVITYFPVPLPALFVVVFLMWLYNHTSMYSLNLYVELLEEEIATHGTNDFFDTWENN